MRGIARSVWRIIVLCLLYIAVIWVLPAERRAIADMFLLPLVMVGFAAAVLSE